MDLAGAREAMAEAEEEGGMEEIEVNRMEYQVTYTWNNVASKLSLRDRV